MTHGFVNKLETFGSVDGPGIRFVVFLQGCPMRCKFCHNPETWRFTHERTHFTSPSGTADFAQGQNGNADGIMEVSAEDLFARAIRYRGFWGKDGGITVSGGEPLMQMDFLTEFFTLAKAAGVHTCIDTSGVNFTRETKSGNGESNAATFEKFQKLLAVTDLLLVDIKHIDAQAHRELTGHDNASIIDFFRYLDEIHKPIWIRHVLVPGINDNNEALTRTRDFIRTLHNVERIDVLPYHAFALGKYAELGIDYALKDTQSPSAESLQNANNILETDKYTRWRNKTSNFQ